jgi:3-isopropylmalate dehydratase small subunit
LAVLAVLAVFAPAEIGGSKTACAKSFAHIFFWECAKAGATAINVNHCHTARVLVSRACKVNAPLAHVKNVKTVTRVTTAY